LPNLNSDTDRIAAFQVTTFLQRLGLHVIDSAFLLGIMVFSYRFFQQTSFSYKTILPLALWYIVFIFFQAGMVSRFGGTLGCFLLGYRIRTSTGHFLTLWKAVLRQLYWIIRMLFDLLLLSTLLSNLPLNILFLSRSGIIALYELNAPTAFILSRIFFHFYMVDLAVIFLNGHQRSLVDFISGSYVVDDRASF